ncbi:hypothetical protein LVD15_05020 [Fulvivirga maritima]|uniref:hypothetical protein n=1 Tax=Fulvivirga maritima TaxID=2904247 RepID=UPI001F1CE90F|nr:hypothetical protein [Fulvivirga maritima]UII27786.1 hypothetical protein LVD15_05020 [Fulvivirga maritima]
MTDNKLVDKTILLISPESWSHIFVSKHHYAIYLARRGNNVFFLNPPTNISKVSTTDFDGVTTVSYKGFPKGLRFYPKFLRRFIIQREFLNLQKLCAVNFDIVWSFDNSVFFDFDALPERVMSISHIVDLNQDYNTKLAAKTADLCIGVIQDIVARLGRFNKNTHLITHGVNFLERSKKKIILPGNNSIKALYVGNLAMSFIDWELLTLAVENNSNVDFIFLGSNKESVPDHLLLNQNVFALNAVPAKELSIYFEAADMLLIAYKDEYYFNYASPHKFWEYLSSGKPIITSFSKEYLPIVELIYMASSSIEWIQLLDEVSKNLGSCSSKEKVNKRKTIASNNSYEKKIQQIERCLQMTP